MRQAIESTFHGIHQSHQVTMREYRTIDRAASYQIHNPIMSVKIDIKRGVNLSLHLGGQVIITQFSLH